MREAWWVPVIELPGERADGGNNVFLILRERTLPGSIMVNGQGRRFTNEAANYNALGGAFHAFDPTAFGYVNQPCWLVFDEGFVQRYGCFGNAAGGSGAGLASPGPARSPSWPALIGVPAHDARRDRAALEQAAPTPATTTTSTGATAPTTAGAATATAYPGPMATLGPLDTAPYYAVGAASARRSAPRAVRAPTSTAACSTSTATPIPGLYAAGNAMAGADRHGLRRRRRHPRPRDGLRLPGRPRRSASQTTRVS